MNAIAESLWMVIMDNLIRIAHLIPDDFIEGNNMTQQEYIAKLETHLSHIDQTFLSEEEKDDIDFILLHARELLFIWCDMS